MPRRGGKRMSKAALSVGGAHADRHAQRQHHPLVVRDSLARKKLSERGWEFLLSGAIWKRGVGYLTRYRLRKITHNGEHSNTPTKNA